MADEKRLIDANALLEKFKDICGEHFCFRCHQYVRDFTIDLADAIREAPAVDAIEVVRCQNCVHAEPLDHNCELSTSYYLHCKMWRGEETKNVWHKYKKYYKDYSLVERDGFCSDGAKMDGDGNG